MKIELKEIDKDTLKVGDWVGIAREVSYGWGSSFRHQLITPAQITRITPKRTKFFTDMFGEHDKREVFFVKSLEQKLKENLAKETIERMNIPDVLKRFSEMALEDKTE